MGVRLACEGGREAGVRGWEWVALGNPGGSPHLWAALRRRGEQPAGWQPRQAHTSSAGDAPHAQPYPGPAASSGPAAALPAPRSSPQHAKQRLRCLTRRAAPLGLRRVQLLLLLQPALLVRAVAGAPLQGRGRAGQLGSSPTVLTVQAGGAASCGQASRQAGNGGSRSSERWAGRGCACSYGANAACAPEAAAETAATAAAAAGRQATQHSIEQEQGGSVL